MNRPRPPQEVAAAGVHGHQLAGVRVGVEATQPDGLLAGAGAGHELAGQLGRDRAEAVEVGRLVAGAEEGAVGHHQAQRDADAGCGLVLGAGALSHRRRRIAPTAAAMTEPTRVSAITCPLVRGSPVARAVSAARVSAAKTPTPSLTGQQRAQPGHRVGRRPQGDVAVGLRLSAPGHERLGVEPVGLALARRHQLPLPHPLETVGVTGHRGVDGRTVLTAQTGRLPGDQGGLPLRDPAAAPGRPGVRQLGRHDLGQPQVPLPAMVGLAPGQRDLRGHPATLLGRGHAGVGLRGALGRVELDRQAPPGPPSPRTPAPPAPGSHRCDRRRPSPLGNLRACCSESCQPGHGFRIVLEHIFDYRRARTFSPPQTSGWGQRNPPASTTGIEGAETLGGRTRVRSRQPNEGVP